MVGEHDPQDGAKWKGRTQWARPTAFALKMFAYFTTTTRATADVLFVQTMLM
jgi:hypothetical protein